MNQATLLSLLADMAEIVDAPSGPGGGAILLEAICEIEDLKRRLPPPEPTTP